MRAKVAHSMAHRVGLIIGSLRAASFSRRVATALPALAPASLAFEEIAIGELPLYDADLEADLPPAWPNFRSAVLASDAASRCPKHQGDKHEQDAHH